MEQLLNLPTPVKVILAVLTGTSIVGGVAMIDPKLAGIVAIGLVLLLLAVAAFLFLRSWARKRKATSMANELSQHSAAAPAGVNDAAKRARLDDMRRTFGEGLTKFGGADNIYKFPWYLIVGEPGSGKTEAIRHSNVGFPPGLQNEMQGVGGTINMNWWFTNQAVFLDTAGRLMFDEVKPGETNEWKEFLQLLLRNRPNCPINGLLLIIPTDALIKDNDTRMNEKAGKIAAQFELIQRTLDIRFPVFVMVTKCDMMSGFREFFDDFADAASVNQMLGWSNPDDRDAPFAPDRVTDHLATVVQRIKKRRLSLLRDPVPQKGEERRTDEVDALYSLPQSIQLLAPRLRQYLEKIFVAGPWSPKPLFLRGIYFTSSMREGAALDQELAQALGLGADQLAEAKVWEKERAYFLRDIFTEKVFRERGLVTRATNTKKMLRTRGLLLWGTASVLALAFVGFTLYAYRQFSDSIKRHSDLWAAAKNPEDWKDARWKPLVRPDKPADTVMRFHGAEPPVAVGDRKVPLLSYHDQLREVAMKPIETGWVYRPMLKAANLDEDRLKAQRIVYDGSIVFPLVQAARSRMLDEPIANAIDAEENSDARLEREARALAALLRIESDNLPLASRKIDDLPEAVLLPLLQYVTASKLPAEEEQLAQLRAGFTATYTGNATAKWVPERLALGASSLAQNAPIQAGLGRLRALAGASVQSQFDSAARIKLMRDDLRKFREIEQRMEATATQTGDPKQKEQDLSALLADLDTVKTGFDARLKAAASEGLVSGEKISLAAGFQKLVSASKERSSANFQLLRAAVSTRRDDPIAKLFKEVDDELTKMLTSASERVAQTFSKEDEDELTRLDSYLDDFGNRRRIYEVRFDTYQLDANIARAKDPTDNLIGTGWAVFSKARKEIDDNKAALVPLQIKLASGSAKDAPNPVPACNFFLALAEERRLGWIANAYLAQTKAKFDANFHDPLVSGSTHRSTATEREAAMSLMGKWKGDSLVADYVKVEPRIKAKLDELIGAFEAMKAAAAADEAHANAVADHAAKMSKLQSAVTFVRQNPLKWKKLNGEDIFFGGAFSKIAGYRSGLTLSLTDDANAPLSGSVSIDTADEGTQAVRDNRGAATLYFEVKIKGDKPPPPPPASSVQKGPRKQPLSDSLTPLPMTPPPADPTPPATGNAPAVTPQPTPVPPKATEAAKTPTPKPKAKKGR